MIDLLTEQLISIHEVPKFVPAQPNGRRVHISSCYRWISRGVRGVKLEVLRIGGRCYTSVEALQRFFDQLSQPVTRDRAVNSVTRSKQLDATARKLDRLLGPVDDEERETA